MRVSLDRLQQLAIFTSLLNGAVVGTMYYLQQKKFSEADYHRLALQKLEDCPVAMKSLGAPPLKVHNIHLTDTHNRVDLRTSQLKIPVTGSTNGGYLYTSSIRDPDTSNWRLTEAVLKLREGETIDLLSSPSVADDTQELDTGHWQ